MKIYEEWYNLIKDQYNPDSEVLEIGSGAGFMKDYILNLITSDLFSIPGVDMVIDAQGIDISDASLDAIADGAISI
jgi:CRISPR/Cas system CSM-associated protein Csm5 (group 7 of RAMP superfamily)